MLQLLCLVAMEPPVAFEANVVRDEKVKVLRSIRPQTPEEILRDTVRGQYAPGRSTAQPVPGYRQEKDVDRRLRPRDVRRAGSSRSRTGAGRACRSTSAPGKRLPEARHRDRDHSSRRPRSPSSGGRASSSRSRTSLDPADPARRGDRAADRRQAARPDDARRAGEDGLPVLGVLRREDPRRLRAAPPRRAATATRPSSRGATRSRPRGSSSRPSSTSGARTRRATSRTTRPGPGGPRRPWSSSPATGAAGGGPRLRPEPCRRLRSPSSRRRPPSRRASAELFALRAAEAVEERGRFLVALAGGTTPLAAYRRLADSPRLFFLDRTAAGED